MNYKNKKTLIEMEIKIDTDALSHNNTNKAANSNQIIEEMMNFHINEIDQFLLKQENKYLIPEYFIIKINAFVIENTEEKSLTILAEIKESHQTLYDFKASDKVLIYSKSNEFFTRLLSHCQRSCNKNYSNVNNKQNNFNLNNFNTKKDFDKNDLAFNSNNINLNNNRDSDKENTTEKIYEIRIDLDENVFFPANDFLNCLGLLYNLSFNNHSDNKEFDNENKNNNFGNEANKLDFQDKLFFIMLALSNIIKFYFFYYKKFKFNKWDSFLLNTPYFEEAMLLSLLINFIGLKCTVNKNAIKNNFDTFALSDLNDFAFELDNFDLILKDSNNKKDFNNNNNINNNKHSPKSSEKANQNDDFLNDDCDNPNANKNTFNNINSKFEYFYANYLKNSINNKIEILNLNEQEAKIDNLQKEEYLNFDFETKYFNYIFDTTGEGLNYKNKILFFKLLQHEGNIIINDNINEKIQIDPRDITFMYNKSISVNFINIIKNLKFNVNQGKLINFVLDFISKMIMISDKNIKNIFNKINFSVSFCDAENEFNLSVEDLTNKNKFLNMFVLDL